MVAQYVYGGIDYIIPVALFEIHLSDVIQAFYVIFVHFNVIFPFFLTCVDRFE